MASTIYYHADCLDGFGAAFAAWRHFGDAATYRPLHHGERWLADEIRGRDVYILDFSFTPEILGEMAELAASVTQLDHHASAMRHWAGQLQGQTGGMQRYHDAARALDIRFHMEQSGARLAWEHFHGEQAMPLLLQHIEDQDLWRFALAHTRAFCRQLRLQPFDFSGWQTLVAATTDANTARYREMVLQGEAIDQFFRIESARLADSQLLCRARLRGEPVDAVQARRHGQEIISDASGTWLVCEGVAVNANGLFASELGNLLAEKSGSFGMIWQISADGDAKISLRSNGDYDVAAIAVRYGGGGHRNAAGFRLPAGQFLAEVLDLVPRKGLEPPRIATPEPKSGASTNFATWAGGAHSNTEQD